MCVRSQLPAESPINAKKTETLGRLKKINYVQFLRCTAQGSLFLNFFQRINFLRFLFFVSAAFILQVVLKLGGASDLIKLKVADFKVDLHSTGLHPWRGV